MSKGRPKRTPQQWSAETRKRNNRFNDFIENPVITNSETGDIEWKAKDGERFVHVYNWYDDRLEAGYAVSDYGTVISFTDEKPLIFSQPAVEGYKEVSLSIRQKETGKVKSKTFRVHRLVWFSFTYDMLKNNEKLPSQYYEIRSLEDLAKLAKSDIEVREVHHMDGQKGNNLLSNLELLPEDIHDILHGVMDREKAGESDLDILIYLAKEAPEEQKTAIAYVKGKALSFSEEDTDRLRGYIGMQYIVENYISKSGRTSGEFLIGLFSTKYNINEILRGYLEKIPKELPKRTGKAITNTDELDIFIDDGKTYFPKLMRGDLND